LGVEPLLALRPTGDRVGRIIAWTISATWGAAGGDIAARR
jgi:hypothetical protein